jgi:hypothetical protein
LRAELRAWRHTIALQTPRAGMQHRAFRYHMKDNHKQFTFMLDLRLPQRTMTIIWDMTQTTGSHIPEDSTLQFTSSSISSSLVFFFLVSLGGVRLSPLGTSATVGLLYQPRMIDADYGAVGGIRNDRGNRSTRKKPAPVPLCSPQIPHNLTWDRTRAAAVGSQQLTA